MLPHSFIGQEKEHFVLDDRAAEISAKLILLIRRLGTLGTGIEKVARVQHIVAEKFKQFPVIFACAGARSKVHDCAGISSVFRRKRRIVDLVFRQGVNRRLKRNLVLHRIVQVDSVHQPVGCVFALARCIDAERSLSTQWRGKEPVCGRRDRPRRQQTKVGEVTAIQRNFLHCLVVDHLPQARSDRINKRGISDNLDCFRGCTNR